MVMSYRLRVLEALPGTYAEIIERAHACRGTVENWLRVLRAEGQAHIGSWKRTEGRGGKYQPVFVAGPGQDAKCNLKRLPSETYQRRYKKRALEDGRYDQALARKRAQYHAERAAAGKKSDFITDALCRRAA